MTDKTDILVHLFSAWVLSGIKAWSRMRGQSSRNYKYKKFLA